MEASALASSRPNSRYNVCGLTWAADRNDQIQQRGVWRNVAASSRSKSKCRRPNVSSRENDPCVCVIAPAAPRQNARAPSLLGPRQRHWAANLRKLPRAFPIRGKWVSSWLPRNHSWPYLAHRPEAEGCAAPESAMRSPCTRKLGPSAILLPRSSVFGASKTASPPIVKE